MSAADNCEYTHDPDSPKPVFQCDEDDVEINLKIPPATGSEYLKRVQMEAKQCPSVVVADVQPSQQKQTFKLFNMSGCQPAPHGFAPDIQWQNMQTARFSHHRQKLALYRTQSSRGIKPPSMKLPLMEDFTGWCRLCFGRIQPRGDNFVQRSIEEQETSGDGIDTSEGTPPLTSIITNMDQPMIIQVLEYHINWFEATGFTQEQGRWFFALLTALEKPLTPEACSLLRTLARHCANLRATLDAPSDPLLIQLNLLICLVSRYFDQMDLADNG